MEEKAFEVSGNEYEWCQLVRDYASEKKDDSYVHDFDDVSSCGDSDGYSPVELSVEEIKDMKRKLVFWKSPKMRTTDLMDTTGASILLVDGNELKQSNKNLFYGLVSMLRECNSKNILRYFIYPGDQGLGYDGGMTAYEGQTGDWRYSAISRIVVQQYNDITKQSKLEFVTLTRVVVSFFTRVFVTFTALESGQIGTYQATVVDDDEDGVHLVLLRHVEADKILAIMSITGAEKELGRM